VSTGRPSIYFMLNGGQKTIAELADMAGCKRVTMYARLRHLSPDEAVAGGEFICNSHPKLYAYKGQMLTRRQLSDISGCGFATMKNRLLKFGPEIAVAMGPGNRYRERPEQRKPRPAVVYKPRGKTYPYGEQMLTIRELAGLAQCSVDTMRYRMSDGIPPQVAVNMGGADKYRARGPRRPREGVERVEKPKKAPKLKLEKPKRDTKAPFRLDPNAPVICNVEPIRLPNTIGHRHATTTIGRWIDSGECRPWARAATGSAA
jgi:hypothetical protein